MMIYKPIVDIHYIPCHNLLSFATNNNGHMIPETTGVDDRAGPDESRRKKHDY